MAASSDTHWLSAAQNRPSFSEKLFVDDNCVRLCSAHLWAENFDDNDIQHILHPEYLLLSDERLTTGDAQRIAEEVCGRLLTASELLQVRDLYAPSCCEEWYLAMEQTIDEVIEASITK